jgi:hypothetical protein
MASNVQQVDITDLGMTTTERGRRRRNHMTLANRVKKELDDARNQKLHLSAAALSNWEQVLQQLVEEAFEANEQCMKNDPGRTDDFNEWAEILNEQHNGGMVGIEDAREEEKMVFTSPAGGGQERTFTEDLMKGVREHRPALLKKHQNGMSEKIDAYHKKQLESNVKMRKVVEDQGKVR